MLRLLGPAAARNRRLARPEVEVDALLHIPFDGALLGVSSVQCRFGGTDFVGCADIKNAATLREMRRGLQACQDRVNFSNAFKKAEQS